MKFMEWLKIMWNKLTKNTVNNIDKLEFEKSKIQKTLEQVEKSMYESQGKKKYFEDSIEEANNKKIQLRKAAKKCVELNDDSLLKRVKREDELLDKKINELTKNLQLAQATSDSLYEQRNLISSKLSEAEYKLDELKMKDDFSKDVESFVKVIGSNEIKTEFEKIAKEIEMEYNSNEYRLEDVTNKELLNDKLEKLMNEEDDSLEEYKKKIMES